MPCRRLHSQHMPMGRLPGKPCPSTLPMSAGTWQGTSCWAASLTRWQAPLAGRTSPPALQPRCAGLGSSPMQALYQTSWRYAAAGEGGERVLFWGGVGRDPSSGGLPAHESTSLWGGGVRPGVDGEGAPIHGGVEQEEDSIGQFVIRALQCCQPALKCC